jgi:hypothetical protein
MVITIHRIPCAFHQKITRDKHMGSNIMNCDKQWTVNRFLVSAWRQRDE